MPNNQLTHELMSLLKSGRSDEDIAHGAGLTFLEILALRASIAARPLRAALRKEQTQ